MVEYNYQVVKYQVQYQVNVRQHVGPLQQNCELNLVGKYYEFEFKFILWMYKYGGEGVGCSPQQSGLG